VRQRLGGDGVGVGAECGAALERADRVAGHPMAAEEVIARHRQVGLLVGEEVIHHTGVGDPADVAGGEARHAAIEHQLAEEGIPARVEVVAAADDGIGDLAAVAQGADHRLRPHRHVVAVAVAAVADVGDEGRAAIAQAQGMERLLARVGGEEGADRGVAGLRAVIPHRLPVEPELDQHQACGIGDDRPGEAVARFVRAEGKPFRVGGGLAWGRLALPERKAGIEGDRAHEEIGGGEDDPPVGARRRRRLDQASRIVAPQGL
jgi:hypothetical protein